MQFFHVIVIVVAESFGDPSDSRIERASGSTPAIVDIRTLLCAVRASIIESVIASSRDWESPSSQGVPSVCSASLSSSVAALTVPIHSME